MKKIVRDFELEYNNMAWRLYQKYFDKNPLQMSVDERTHTEEFFRELKEEILDGITEDPDFCFYNEQK